ncbi:hypothetical protein [Streptomyces sp. NPDC058084]|uniref:hypothetical protein n=1 Tax=Streptomyces sp. NPDC058084 TaxID=3346333 RepID=UPI0036EA09C8
MPLPANATTLLALAATALEDIDSIDTTTLDASIAHDLATITFTSSGNPATDRYAIEQINGELCVRQLDLTLPVIVRPKDDDATLAAAADSLRHLATLLDRVLSGTDQEAPLQMGRGTALKFAENVLSSVG